VSEESTYTGNEFGENYYDEDYYVEDYYGDYEQP
jgi:hypothetical protein